MYDGYKTKYEKSISNDEYTKSACIYEVENGYVVKVETIPKGKENGMSDYENRECKYYITQNDPSKHLSEGSSKEEEDKDNGGDAATAIKKLF